MSNEREVFLNADDNGVTVILEGERPLRFTKSSKYYDFVKEALKRSDNKKHEYIKAMIHVPTLTSNLIDFEKLTFRGFSVFESGFRNLIEQVKRDYEFYFRDQFYTVDPDTELPVVKRHSDWQSIGFAQDKAGSKVEEKVNILENLLDHTYHGVAENLAHFILNPGNEVVALDDGGSDLIGLYAWFKSDEVPSRWDAPANLIDWQSGQQVYTWNAVHNTKRSDKVLHRVEVPIHSIVQVRNSGSGREMLAAYGRVKEQINLQ